MKKINWGLLKKIGIYGSFFVYVLYCGIYNTLKDYNMTIVEVDGVYGYRHDLLGLDNYSYMLNQWLAVMLFLIFSLIAMAIISSGKIKHD